MAHLPALLALAAALAAGDSPSEAPVSDASPPVAQEQAAAAAAPATAVAPEAAPASPATSAPATPATTAPAAPATTAPATATPPAAATPEPLQPEAPAVLIRRSMDAYGGSRARVRLGRVRVAGTVSSSLHPGEVGRFARTFVRGRGLRLEVGFTKSESEVRLLDGARAWRYGEPAPAPVTATLQLEAARLELPALLLDRETAVQDQGEVKHEGQTLRVLGLELAPGSRLECGIEPRTGRILYVRSLVQSGPREIELFTVFRSFKVVDGVLVPFREESYANGQSTGDVDVKAVEFLDEVPEAVFRP